MFLCSYPIGTVVLAAIREPRLGEFTFIYEHVGQVVNHVTTVDGVSAFRRGTAFD